MEYSDVFEFYKSMDMSHRQEEAYIISSLVDEGVFPEVLRYGIMKNVYRGVAKSTQDEIYYFNYFPGKSIKFVKAVSPEQMDEVNRLLEKCTLGCDLIKAEGSSGGGSGGGGEPTGVGLPTIEEDEDVVAQQDLMTDKHPGAAIGATPDRPEVGRQWHQEQAFKSDVTNQLLRSVAKNLKKSSARARPISESEKRFIIEVLGRSPEEISSGNVYMNPTQKVIYQRWLNKSLKQRLNNLSERIKK